MSSPKDSRISRRLEEIERDLKRVQKSMRATADGRKRAPLRPDSTPFSSATRSLHTGVKTEAGSDLPATERGPRSSPFFDGVTPAPQPDLFQASRRPDGGGAASPATNVLDGQQRHRFVRYLSSGGFMGSMPLRQERSHQKARAIFMIFVVILAAYIVWWLSS